jgi:hypothetical protein
MCGNRSWHTYAMHPALPPRKRVWHQTRIRWLRPISEMVSWSRDRNLAMAIQRLPIIVFPRRPKTAVPLPGKRSHAILVANLKSNALYRMLERYRINEGTHTDTWRPGDPRPRHYGGGARRWAIPRSPPTNRACRGHRHLPCDPAKPPDMMLRLWQWWALGLLRGLPHHTHSSTILQWRLGDRYDMAVAGVQTL